MARSSRPCEAACSQAPKLLPEVLDQECRIGAGDVADRLQAEAGELFRRLRADAVDLARRQRPDAGGDVGVAEQRQSVGLVELGGDLRQQLVGRDADRAGEAGALAHGRLEIQADRATGIVVDSGQVAQVGVDLVDAAILDQRRDLAHRALEQARVLAVLVEVDRQQHRVRREHCRLHHPHRREHAELARLVSAGRDDAAADVVAQRRELARAVGAQPRLARTTAADDHRAAAQLGIAQQLDRRIEGVHVDVGDEPGHEAATVRAYSPPRQGSAAAASACRGCRRMGR